MHRRTPGSHAAPHQGPEGLGTADRIGETVSDAELEALRAALQSRLPAYLADLERLVSIDSGSYDKAGVDQVGRWVAAFLEGQGFATQTVPDDRLGDTIVAAAAGEGTRRLLLIGHLDTVFPVGTGASRPFRIDGAIARGPGVSDMKGGLLAGLHAVAALREVLGVLPFERLVFVANPDEEIGSPVSTPIIRQQAEAADACLVLEAARASGDIVSARKGMLDLELAVRGRAAHAGVEPEKGRSAIVEAAHLVLAIHALNGRWPGLTCNVGVMHGGSRPNVVAEDASLDVDLRAVSRGDLEAAEAEIRRLAAASHVPDTTVQVREVSRHWPMERLPGTVRLARQAREIAERLGFGLADVSTGGASDANTTAGMGVPTLDGLGPIGGLDHSPDEYLDVGSVVPRMVLLAGLLLSAARDEALRSARP